MRYSLPSDQAVLKRPQVNQYAYHRAFLPPMYLNAAMEFFSAVRRNYLLHLNSSPFQSGR